MDGSRHLKLLVTTVLAALAVMADESAAQVQHEVTFRNPGAMRSNVWRASSGFTRQSYGLGGLQAPSSPSVNVLRSSIESRANYTVGGYGGSADSTAGGILPVLPPVAGRGSQSVYKPLTLTARSALPGPTYSTLATSALGAADDYLTAIGTPMAPQPDSDLITSMVPSGKGDLSEHVAKGEKAFREGDYEAAMREFQRAYVIDSRNPETLLSLAHACFASASGFYYRTSYYLRKALKYLPELPLAPLSPKSFFSDQTQYAGGLARLQDHLKRFPNDSDGHFVLAYLRWFDQDVGGARQALFQARRYAKSAELTEAIQTFWDGMVASGKVSGELMSATQPATARPVAVPAPSAAPGPSPGAPQADSGAGTPSGVETK